MEVVSVVAGLALIGLVLRDIFDTLFHPHGSGILSERLIGAIWRLMRRLARERRTMLSTAGPLAFIAVIFAWATGIVTGGALVILPSLPDGFAVTPGQHASGFGDAIYVSFVSLTSLGHGDVVPTGLGLKLLGPAQAAIGLGILSAAIAWIVSTYSVLRTARSAAREIDLFALGDRVDPAELSSITSQLIAFDIELRQFPIAYHFPSLDSRREICLALGRLFELVESPPLDGTPQARRAEAAADGLLAAVNERFLGAQGTTEEEILELWQADQLWR